MGRTPRNMTAVVRALSFASLIVVGVATPSWVFGQCTTQADYPWSDWSFTLTSDGTVVESGTFELLESGWGVARVTSGEVAPGAPFEIELDTTGVAVGGGLLYVLSGAVDADGCAATLTWTAPSGSSGAGSMAFLGDTQSPFIRGDCNADGAVTIADVVYMVSWLAVPGAPLSPCVAACDSNDDGLLDISDAIDLVTALFITGAPLPAPYPGCETDPTPATAFDAACEYYTACP